MTAHVLVFLALSLLTLSAYGCKRFVDWVVKTLDGRDRRAEAGAARRAAADLLKALRDAEGRP
ncbi:MAG: hypothetical protein J6333_04715 [Planctomycetes bacterium]|nr:hypothetical protein [Planctomycetota bacterium]